MSFSGCEDGNNLAVNGHPSILHAPKRCQSLPMTGCTWELREARSKVEARHKRWSEVLQICSKLQSFSNIRKTTPVAASQKDCADVMHALTGDEGPGGEVSKGPCCRASGSLWQSSTMSELMRTSSLNMKCQET